MIELSKEISTTILDGFKILTAIHDYNPSFSIDTNKLCLKTSKSKFNLEEWPAELISYFLLKIVSIDVDHLDGMEVFESFQNSDQLDTLWDNFTTDFEDEFDFDINTININNLETSSELFDEFIKYIEDGYHIIRYSITSSFLSDNFDTSYNFMSLVPFYLSSYLGIVNYCITNVNFTKNKNNQDNTIIFYADSTDIIDEFESNFQEDLIANYTKIFISYLKDIKKRHSQI